MKIFPGPYRVYYYINILISLILQVWILLFNFKLCLDLANLNIAS